MAWFFNNVFKNQNPFQIKIFTDKCMMTIKVSSRIPWNFTLEVQMFLLPGSWAQLSWRRIFLIVDTRTAVGQGDIRENLRATETYKKGGWGSLWSCFYPLGTFFPVIKFFTNLKLNVLFWILLLAVQVAQKALFFCIKWFISRRSWQTMKLPMMLFVKGNF